MLSQNIEESVRIDKWLWAVRICKTRQVAADLCKRQKVFVDGQLVKPSREIREGQLVMIRKEGIEWQYKVLKCIKNRVGAKVAVECREDLTPQEQIDKLKMMKEAGMPRRASGAGRPTKKERRDIERVFEKGAMFEDGF